MLLDNFRSDFPDLAKGQVFVHTSLRRIREISWNRKKNDVTLHRQKTESITIKNYKIMAKMNEMSARALTMEELENVNGGIGIPRGGRLTIRVK